MSDAQSCPSAASCSVRVHSSSDGDMWGSLPRVRLRLSHVAPVFLGSLCPTRPQSLGSSSTTVLVLELSNLTLTSSVTSNFYLEPYVALCLAGKWFRSVGYQKHLFHHHPILLTKLWWANWGPPYSGKIPRYCYLFSQRPTSKIMNF